MTKVRVNLPNCGYTIHIAPAGITQSGRLIGELGVDAKALVVSDTNVAALYGDILLRSLRDAGIQAELITICPGEDSKALSVAMDIFTKAISMGLERKSPIIALGGGVVGDLTGFVAATYLRGVPFVQVPTTLLAQVDSSVGGKVAVNHPLGKNLIGAFYQPLLVIADTNVLATLPRRELATGLAEVIKHGIIADADYFGYIRQNSAAILAGQQDVLDEIVRGSCAIKARVVEADEKESHLRMILNFGHTIGHAVEANTGYKRYTHGEAVAIGMHGAALISRYLGLCSAEAVEAVRSMLNEFGLPLTSKECCPDDLMSFLSRDKKSVGGTINWVLLNAIGKVSISSEVPEQVVRQVLAELT